MKAWPTPMLWPQGVNVEPIEAAGMIHGFYDLGGISPAAAELVARATKLLRACCTNFA